MQASIHIQLDASFAYQQAALSATYRTLCQTHGEAFAGFFVSECREQVLQAAKTRLCGLSEAAVLRESERLKNGHDCNLSFL